MRLHLSLIGLTCFPLASKIVFTVGAIFPDSAKLDKSICSDFGGFSSSVPSSVSSPPGWGFSLIKGLRKKEANFYELLTNRISMKTCDVNDPYVTNRCVDPQAASLNYNDGMCEEAADTKCKGKCERQSNCYWEPVRSNTKRDRRFSGEERKIAVDYFGFSLNPLAQSYIGDLMIFSYAGLGLGSLCFIGWFIFLIGRFCCCCLWNKLCNCCSPIPRKEYSSPFFQIALPKTIYFCSFLGVVGGAAILIVGNFLLSRSMDTTMDRIVETPSELKSQISDAISPMYSFLNTVEDSLGDLKSIFSQNEATSNEDSSLFSDYFDLYRNTNDSDLSSQIESVTSEYGTSLQKVNDQILSVNEILNNDTLSLSVKRLSAAIDNTNFAFESSKEELDYVASSLKAAEKLEQDFSTHRNIVMGLFISFSLFTVTFGFLPLHKPHWFCFQRYDFLNPVWIVGSFLGILGFYLSAATLAAGISNYDACNVAKVAVSNFEPLFGERIATGMDACFRQESLLPAYGINSDLGSLDEMENLVSSFKTSSHDFYYDDQLQELQKAINSLPSAALDALNDLTSSNTESCPFNDVYTSTTATTPWAGRSDETQWKLSSTDNFGSYLQKDDESNVEYIKRIYSVAGSCEGENVTDCDSPCSNITNLISSEYQNYLETLETVNSMTSDLGLSCPNESCPSKKFQGKGRTLTLAASLKLSKKKYERIESNSTSILNEINGKALKLSCSMDCSYIVNQYDLLQEEFCEHVLNNILLVSGGFWVISVFLNLSSVLAAILGVRLMKSKREMVPEEQEHHDDSPSDDATKSKYLQPVNTGVDIPILESKTSELSELHFDESLGEDLNIEFDSLKGEKGPFSSENERGPFSPENEGSPFVLSPVASPDGNTLALRPTWSDIH